MARRLLIAFALLVMLFLVACGGSGQGGVEPGITAVAESTPKVTVQSTNPDAEDIQLIQLDNCDGKADLTRTEVRSQSVEAEISAEVALQIGASAQVIYGNVQTAVATALRSSSTQETAIGLVSPPGTKMEFQLIWIGDEEVGVVQNILNSEVPIAFRSFSPRDVRIKSQYDVGCPESLSGAGQNGNSSQPEVQESSAEGSPAQPQSSSEEALPADVSVEQDAFRERFTASIGTGPMGAVQFSDGLAEYTADFLAMNHGRLQTMNIVSTPTGCTTAFYASERIWFGSTRPTKISINGQLVAEYTQPGDFRGGHGSIFDWKVNIGDEICVEMTPEIQFHLNFGPDVDIHYDSYCFRGNC